MRTTYRGIRELVRLFAVIAVLAVGIVSVGLVPTRHAMASHGGPNTQLAIECPSGLSHC
ncbi:MAG: hypothetical protein OJF49_002764 [Ktedonobacterales bacterium]|jgi:hypothetical protein|nr:MAG: hypothetical protein OJF49_002764 [Ktedonobacterales bacterium]